MNVRTLCLAVLNFQEASGYEIKKLSLEGPCSYFIDASFGSIYPALARLEKDGLVTAREEAHAGKPARKIYAITPAGRTALVSALSEVPAPDIFRSEFLLVAVCAPMLSRAVVAAAVDLTITRLEDEAAVLRESCECDDAASTWAVNYGLAMNAAMLAYLRTNRDALIALARDDALPLSRAAE